MLCSEDDVVEAGDLGGEFVDVWCVDVAFGRAVTVRFVDWLAGAVRYTALDDAVCVTWCFGCEDGSDVFIGVGTHPFVAWLDTVLFHLLDAVDVCGDGYRRVTVSG